MEESDRNMFDQVCDKALCQSYSGELEETELSLFKTLV